MTFETNNLEDISPVDAEWHHERLDHLDIRGRLCTIAYALDMPLPKDHARDTGEYESISARYHRTGGSSLIQQYMYDLWPSFKLGDIYNG